MGGEGRPYGARVREALARGARAGLALRARREAAGRRASDGGQFGAMPRILHDQLVGRYGPEWNRDEGLMRDLRRRYPEMMAADGDVPGESADGTRNAHGRVSMRFRRGRWERPDGRGGWEAFEPPSRMDWGGGEAPGILG